MQEISSPITNGQTRLLIELPSSDLGHQYFDEFNIDIQAIMGKTDMVKLYECLDTGYRFFYPFNLAGDGKFYEQLEQASWYYAENKWDYSNALKYLTSEKNALDIGCGAGHFLTHLKSKGIAATGLELNNQAVENGAAQGLDIRNEMIQDHAKHSENTYDLVSFFQVLEHIADVKDFLESAIAVTKPGGKIVIAVPNNYPYYLKKDIYHTLNWPPHHMGWWNKESLTNLSKTFPIELLNIETEPLQHFGTYTDIFLRDKITALWLKKIISPFVKTYFYFMRNSIPGASIMAVYQKK